MRHLAINRSRLHCKWRDNPILQLEPVYHTPFERVYEGPDMRINIGLKRAYLFVYHDEDYQRICDIILKNKYGKN